MVETNIDSDGITCKKLMGLPCAVTDNRLGDNRRTKLRLKPFSIQYALPATYSRSVSWPGDCFARLRLALVDLVKGAFRCDLMLFRPT